MSKIINRFTCKPVILITLTQVEVQGELPFLQLQGYVVSTLSFSMEQDSIPLHALELQGNYIFECAHKLLIEPVEK